MYSYAGGGAGGGDANFAGQQGYQTRSRGRGRYEAQEERYVEGDLFGSTKRTSFRSSDPPVGQPPRATYSDTRLNTFRNGAAGVSGGGYGQSATAQPSPFAGRPAEQSGFMAAGGGSADGTMGGTRTGAVYGGGGYGGQAVNGAGVGRAEHNGSNAAWSGGEVALVPVDSNGSSRIGQSSMLDDEDDDFMPTRSLADNDVGDAAGAGLRQRRGGGGGRARGGADQAFGRHAEPDVQRATWVVVWGVPQEKATDVLTRFLQFGHIEEQRGQPDSNWLYFKYATRLQAEKALAAGHTARLTERVMLGVSRVDDEAWQALREGRIPSLAAAQPVLSSRPAAGGGGTSTPGNSRVAMEVDDTDLLGAPPQRPQGERSVCGRVMAFFGFY